MGRSFGNYINASARLQVANIYRHSSAYVWSDRVACTIHADAVPGPPAAFREDRDKDKVDRGNCPGIE